MGGGGEGRAVMEGFAVSMLFYCGWRKLAWGPFGRIVAIMKPGNTKWGGGGEGGYGDIDGCLMERLLSDAWTY